MGRIALAGGAEFGGRMRELDRRTMELAGGDAAAIHIIPAAAAPDNNQHRAGARGEQWFRSLGAKRVYIREITDRATADDPKETEAIGAADLIYLLGGFPAHLANSLRGSTSWQAAIRVYEAGAVVCGSSAGAMVLGNLFYDPTTASMQTGLSILGPVVVIPHHEKSGSSWAGRLQSLVPDAQLLGLDECTGIIDDGKTGGWTVHGGGEAVVYQGGEQYRYRDGQVIPFSQLPPPVDPKNLTW
jgi:cyanophycinase